MPDITLPNNVAADTTTVAANVKGNIYAPSTPSTTFEVANGRLDEDNLHSSTTPLSKELIRRGSFIKASTSGANANTDYFEDLFLGNWSSAVGEELEERMLPICGTGHPFYVPWSDCKGVYFAWHISAVVAGMSVTGLGASPFSQDKECLWDFSDVAAALPDNWGGRVSGAGFPLDIGVEVGTTPHYWTTAQGATALMLYVDGTPTWATLRRLPDGMNSMAPPYDSGSGDDAFSQQFFPDARHWSGHFVIDFINKSDTETSGTLTDNATVKGWHTVELRVAHTAKGVRFKTRRMTAIPFR